MADLITINDKLLINIFGPSTAGKSTLADMMHDRIDRLYTVDYDIIKRQISHYRWQRDSQVGTELSYDTLAAVAKFGLSILLLMPPPKTSEDHARVVELADEHGYRLHNIEITAPREVLIERYQARLDMIRQSGSKAAFRTIDEFIAKLDIPYYRPDDAVSYDSSVMSPDEIFEQVMSLISSE